MLLLTVYSYKSAISKLQDDLETQKRSMPDLHSVKEPVKEIGLSQKLEFHDYIVLVLETCFSFLIHCWPIRARECDIFKITKKIENCNFSDFSRDFLIIFLQNRFYPDVEFFG